MTQPLDLQRRAEEARAASARHDAAVGATEHGRTSVRLRARATELAHLDDEVGAHALFVQAADLFTQDDDSEAAAAARYDLAESLRRLPTGSHLDNVVEARRLYEQALRSEGRRQDPLRAARTEDALGQTLRELSDQPLASGEDPQELLKQAALHHVEACQLAESAGTAGFSMGAQAYVSLGNTLRQLGDAESAVGAFERGLALARSAGADPGTVALTGIGLARALLQRGPAHVGRALAVLADVEREGPPPEAAIAGLEWACAAARQRPKVRKQAVARLRRLNLAVLSAENRLRAVQLLIDVGEHDAARVVLHQATTDAWARHAQARADHVADLATAHLQALAHLEAQLHLDAGNPTAAFLAIENAAALRYGEAISGHGWRARDPVARKLAQLRDLCSATSVALDDLAARWTHSPNTDALPYAAAMVSSGPEELGELWAEARMAVEGLRASASPLPVLRRMAERFVVESARLSSLLITRDPNASPDTRPEGRHRDAAALERVLTEAGDGTVLVHLHLGEDVLVCAIWLDEQGILTGRAGRIGVPPGLREVLGSRRGEGLAGPLAELDLGELLPTSGEHLVILPSLLASLVPWAAAGPKGRTLLDRFGAISFLPNLGPALGRQVVHRERGGHLVVAPAELPADRPTRFHGVALTDRLEGEERLMGAAATCKEFARAVQDADVLTFYAHGHRGGMLGGGICLADRTITPADFADGLVGAERVELWACDSGVNLPHDWLTPSVDEPFGLDVELHRLGVRSTIGTLWSVNEIVTALIVREYRQRLKQGAGPARALADAQRWWCREALATVEQVLREEPPLEWTDAIARRLGPIELGGRASPKQVQAALRRMSEPGAWAGFRFLGVAGRQPVVLDEPPPLDDAGREELRALLTVEPNAEWPFDEIFADWVEKARSLKAGELPSSERALLVGRLYADRRPGVHRHNVLRGLAWLHEAFAATGETELRAEAAWLWLDLARGELPDDRARILYPPDPFYLRRLAQVVEGLDHPDESILHAWVEVLQVAEPDEVIREARRVFGTAWTNAAARPIATYEGLRARTAALELLLLVPDPAPPEGFDAQPGAVPLELAVRAAALKVVVARLTRSSVEPPPASLLSHRDLAGAFRWAAGGLELPEAAAAWQRMLDTHIGLIEGDHWGYAADDRTDLWLATGTTGRAWFDAVGLYLHYQVLRRGDESARHVVASAHFGADLRLGALNAWVRIFGRLQKDESPRMPWWPARALDANLQQLEDAARLLTELPNTPGWADAFRHSLEVEAAIPSCAVAATFDQLSAAIRNWLPERPKTRTAAFALERSITTFEDAARAGWAQIARGLVEAPAEIAVAADQVRERLSPPLALAHVEAWVDQLEDGGVLLTLLPGPGGRLVAAAVGTRAGRRHGRTFASETLVETRARGLLAELVAPSEDRREVFAELRALLDGVLTEVLGDFAGGTLPYLSVMTPGPLRGLPWMGLTLRDRPLRDLFSGIASLPHAGFERTLAEPLSAPPHTVCVLGVDDCEATPFGAAAVRTVRQVHGVQGVAEPGRIQGRSIDEVDVIEAHAARTRTLRFYGGPATFTLNPTTEGLSLRAGRTFTTLNLADTLLPVCEVVELWAPTGSRGEARSISDADRDVMPNLVRAFLAAGAGGVLDLAWPVPDLVHALVYEQFAHRRAAEPTPGPLALRMALQVTEHRLASLARSFMTSSLRTALGALDDARREDVRELGKDAGAVVPFAASAYVGDGPAAPVLAEVLEPVHLAAFRWWGP